MKYYFVKLEARIRKNLNATSKMIWFYFELVGGEVLIGFGSNNHYCMHVCMFYVHTKLKQKQLHVKLRSSCLQRTDVTIELAPILFGTKSKTGPHYEYFPNNPFFSKSWEIYMFILYTTVYLAYYANGVKLNRTFLNDPDWIKDSSRMSMDPCFSNRHKYRLIFLRKSLLFNILSKILTNYSSQQYLCSNFVISVKWLSENY